MAAEGSEARARTTTPASLVPSEVPLTANSYPEEQEEMLIRHLQPVQPQLDPQEGTFLTDFLPPSVLQAVVQRPAPSKDLGPTNTDRLQLKDVLPQLEDYPPLFLADNKRDVSFLGDIQALPQIEEKPSKLDPSAIRFIYQESLKPKKKAVEIPESLIPERFYVKKNAGLLGLEYESKSSHERPLEEREKELIIFPSERPGKREEVIYLKNAVEKMRKEASLDPEVEVIGSPQMKKMLAGLRKEQEMNDIFFNELIRQTMVENSDRAEILTILRQFYNQLLKKVPVEVNSLHDEVMAQRALDKKLTIELMRFKTTIGVLTGELSDIRQHDQRISQQAQDTQNDLKMALEETDRNTELLEEYHALYELQRKRLEKAVAQNNEEKETWSTAAYCLALKIVQEGRLNTSKRLHVAEKAWTQLASHFTLLLSDLDTEQLTGMHATIGKWREAVEVVSTALLQKESNTKEALTLLRDKMQGFRTVYEQKYVVNGELQRTPDPEKRPNILMCVVEWQNILIDAIESQRQENVEDLFAKLDESETFATTWSDRAGELFERHRSQEGKSHPDREKVFDMSQDITDLTRHIRSRVGGDGSVLEGASRVLEVVAEWLERCEFALSNQEDLPEEEWLSLDDVVNNGLEQLEDLFKNLQQGQMQMNPEALQNTHQGMADLARCIDALDLALVASVSSLHERMVGWMMRALLRLAPPRADASEAKEEKAEETLQEEAEKLFEELDGFSRYLTTCCWDVAAVSKTQKEETQNGGSDGLELDRLQNESDEWILSAKLLMREIFGEETSKSEKSPSDMKSSSTGEERQPLPVGPSESDLKKEKLQEEEKEKEEERKAKETGEEDGEKEKEGGEATVDENEAEKAEREETPPPEAFESFAAMETLKEQFKDAFQRTKQAIGSADEASDELSRSRTRLADLEARVAAVAAEIAAIKGKPQTPEKAPALLREPSSGPAPKAGTTGGPGRTDSPDDFPIKLAGEGAAPARPTPSATPTAGKTTPRSKGPTPKGDTKRGSKAKKK